MSKSIQFKDKNNEKIYPLAFVPIGYVILTVINENPSKYYEGVFELTAKGCALVGVDFDDNDFKEPEKIIGEKEHELTIDEMPSHKHDVARSYQYIGFDTPYVENVLSWKPSSTETGVLLVTSLTTGGSKKHNNIQPSFPLFIWKRVA